MITLFDIAPPELLKDEVDIRGKKLPVAGISATQWLKLYQLFPDLRAINAGEIEESDVPPARRFASQTALITAGLGKLGDKETEKLVMERLTREERRDIINKVLDLSLPGDIFGPLLNGEAEGATNLASDESGSSPQSPE